MGAFCLYPHPLPVKAINTAPARDGPEVLHYVGYDSDRGGVVSIIRTLSGEPGFRCVLGVNRGFRQLREPPLPVLEFPPLEGERLGLRTLWRARRVARLAQDWLRRDDLRGFPGHSRAGLAVSLWLARLRGRKGAARVDLFG